MKTKKKILFRHRSMEMGGVEKVLINTLKNLDKDKFEITFCVNIFQGELKNEIPNHINYIKLSKGKESFATFLPFYYIQIILRWIKLYFLEKFPALVHIFFLKDQYDVEIASTYAAYSGILKSPNKKSKKIGWLHSDLSHPKLKPYTKQFRQNLNQFDTLIFGSKQTESENVEYFKQKFTNSVVIYNAIDRNEILFLANEFEVEKNETFTFIAVSRLHFRKRIEYILEAHKTLLDKGYKHRVLIIGDGEERKKIEELIKTYKVENTFILKGTLLNPYPYIKNSDCYIMPSETESYPLVLVETLMIGVPIIATDVGGNKEIVEHNVNGWLIPSTVEDITNKMENVLIDKKGFNNVKENNKTAYKKFDNNKIFKQIEELLNS